MNIRGRAPLPALLSLVLAGLAILALLSGTLALHTTTGAHSSHGAVGALATVSVGTTTGSGHHSMSNLPTASAGAAVGQASMAAGPAADERGLGTELLAACALLLALAASAVLLLRLGRMLRSASGARGDQLGDGRFRVPLHPAAPAHPPDLMVLSVSRR